MTRDTTPFRFECSGEGWPHNASENWGPCRRLIEVLDDQFASRQIDFYESGQVLKYDRSHPRDTYGYLIGLRFSRKLKWRAHFNRVRLISEAEFEREWAAATTRREPI